MEQQQRDTLVFLMALVTSLCITPGSSGAELSAVNWETDLGPGGAEYQEPLSTDDYTAVCFSTVEAIVFPPGGEEILFVGEPAGPDGGLITTDELLDGFVIAYRALARGDAPGVDIRPNLEQLRRGVRAGDMMPVEYYGADRNLLGGIHKTAFLADRLMKSLSLGIDNVTRQPLRPEIPGFLSHLALSVRSDDQGEQSWTRFWIEHASGRVGISDDSRTLLLDATMVVEAHPQEVTASGFDDGDTLLPPAAAQFVDHMTEYYEKYYAPYYPKIFGKLLQYGKIVYGANAVLAYRVDASNAPLVDEVWLQSGHQPRAVATELETPAARSESAPQPARVESGVLHILSLLGGVDMSPKNASIQFDPDAVSLEDLVLSALRDSGNRATSITWQGRPLAVVPVPLHQGGYLAAWQTDGIMSPVPITRHFRGASGGEFGDWSLNLPKITEFATDKVTLSSGEEMAAYARVRDEFGGQSELSQFATLQRPGEEPVLAFVSGDGNESLHRSGDYWVYSRGTMSWESVNGGPYQLILPPDGVVIEFDTSSHRVLTVTLPIRTLTYGYQVDQLVSITDAVNNGVSLEYDSAGRIKRLFSSAGGEVAYHYTEGRLRQVVRNDGNRLIYSSTSSEDGLAALVEDFSQGFITQTSIE